MSEGVLALIATLFGATGLKVVEYLLSRNQVKADMDAALRKELRLDVESLREELKGLKTELDEKQDDLDKWRERYFRIVSELYKHGITPPVD